jgi:hypothetical protein
MCTVGIISTRAKRAPHLNLACMFRVATVEQQIMSEFNGAVSVETKTAAIKNIVLNLMKQNGH